MSMSSDSVAGQPTPEVARPEHAAGYVRPTVTVVGPVAQLTQLGSGTQAELTQDGSTA
jgi:hypothetical protein